MPTSDRALADRLAIVVAADRSPVEVRLRGELDGATAPRLREALTSLGAADVVVDLRDVTFCDSAGAFAFVGVHRAVEGLGGRLELRNLEPWVRTLFETSRLDLVLDLRAAS